MTLRRAISLPWPLDEALGFLTLGECRDPDLDQKITGEIWGIYLDPKHWREGIGTLLYQYGERILTGRGYRSATLWIFSGNDQARRFYESMEHKDDGATKVLNLGKVLATVRYRKILADIE